MIDKLKPNPPHDTSVFLARRKQLMEKMIEGIAILPTAPEYYRNADNPYPFRPDSAFWYLTGFPESNAVLVLDADQGRSVLFCRDKNVASEIWTGFRYGPVAAAEYFGLDEAYSIEHFDEHLLSLLEGRKKLFRRMYAAHPLDQRIELVLQRVRAQSPKSGFPECFSELDVLIDEMRLVKDAQEIASLKQAGQISALAHHQAMTSARPGRFEYEIEAELIHTFIQHGARYPAFESIVASGENTCTLHYTANRKQLHDGELLLIDAGCEYAGYAGDISRTFPVNGRFTGEQKAVYEIVLAAQQAAIGAIAPGAPWNEPADIALAILVQGMVDLGLLSGSVEGLIESQAYKQFYMHGIGHWLGLDVHDVGGRYHDGQFRLFEPGMCTTVEPGLYIRPADNVPEALYNIGVRIEDNILVTEEGCLVYTGTVPKEIAAIEQLMTE